jgi:4-oxalocrotonate tautomerase
MRLETEAARNTESSAFADDDDRAEFSAGASWREAGCVTQQQQKGVTKMPEITVSLAVGRTDEHKAGMLRDITQALVKNLGVDADAVVIQINEAPLANKMKGGKTFVERAAAAKK